jgi:hypothetical protein
MTHPAPETLLELHFGELDGIEGDTLAAHVRACPPCSSLLEELRGLERALAIGPDDGPPADGLERVLTRVGQTRPAHVESAQWIRAVVPSAAALLVGAWGVAAGAGWLRSLGFVPEEALGAVGGGLLALSLAALGVVGVGAVVTLAVAPVLILESRGRS